MRSQQTAAASGGAVSIARAEDAVRSASAGADLPGLLGQAVDARLSALIPAADAPPQRLHTAMRYTLLAPGKRLRPVLALMTSIHLGRSDLAALDAACAIEMIHAASLVFDDLPAMDNSDERRGQATLHRRFDEHVAILAGIALLNRAFGVVSCMEADSDAVRAAVARALSEAVGSEGLVGGQFLDLAERDGSQDCEKVEEVNRLKTAALFIASAEAGAIVAGASAGEIMNVRAFARELGLAFQIADDFMDDARFAGLTGKDTCKDAEKPTVISVLGRSAALSRMNAHLAAAHEHLAALGRTSTALQTFIGMGFTSFEKRARGKA